MSDHKTWLGTATAGYPWRRLVAVAKDVTGRVLARDEVETAGTPYALRLEPDRTVLRADGKWLSYITVHLVDAHGLEVPDNAVTFAVNGAGSFQGADNGKEDDAEGYKSSTHDAWGGKVLAIVQSGTHPGPIRVTATSDGWYGAGVTLYVGLRTGRNHGHFFRLPRHGRHRGRAAATARRRTRASPEASSAVAARTSARARRSPRTCSTATPRRSGPTATARGRRRRSGRSRTRVPGLGQRELDRPTHRQQRQRVVHRRRE